MMKGNSNAYWDLLTVMENTEIKVVCKKMDTNSIFYWL